MGKCPILSLCKPTCVYDLAFCVQVIECVKGPSKDKGQDWGWQPPDWVSMQEVQHTLPQWKMHQALVSAMWTVDLETVKQGPDSTAANMVPGSCFNTFIHVDFIVQLVSHGL